MRGLGLGFTNPVGTGGVLDVYMCSGYGGVGGVGGAWVGGLDQGICVLYLADTCASEVHPVFNPVAPYAGYKIGARYSQNASVKGSGRVPKSVHSSVISSTKKRSDIGVACTTIYL